MRNKAVFIALGVQADGTKDILGHRTREQRRGQVLAARHERVEEPGRQRRSDRRRRRIEGLPRSDQRRLSADHRSNLHRASHPPFDGFRLLERPQSPRRRIEGDLSSQRRRRGQVSAGGFRREPLGPKNIRRSRRAGDAIGSASFRSSPFRRPSGGSSTRRTPSRRSTPNYAAPCAREVIFLPTTPRRSSCFSSCARPLQSGKRRREWLEAKTQFVIMFDERFVQA